MRDRNKTDIGKKEVKISEAVSIMFSGFDFIVKALFQTDLIEHLTAVLSVYMVTIPEHTVYRSVWPCVFFRDLLPDL